MEDIYAGGKFSNNIEIQGKELQSSGGTDIFIVKYNEKREIEWATSVGENGNDDISSIIETDDGGYIVGASIGAQTLQLEGYSLISGSALIKYSNNGIVQWAETISNSTNSIEAMDTLNSGYIVGEGKRLIKYNEHNTIEWEKNVQDSIQYIESTKDGGFVLLRGYDYIDKYDSQNKLQWSNRLSYSIKGVKETADNGFIIITYDRLYKYNRYGKLQWEYKGSESEYSKLMVLKGDYIIINENGGISRISMMTNIEDKQDILVENNLKTFKITTSVQEMNYKKGGNISGEESEVYEEVKYNMHNELPIVMTPKPGYEIVKITINDVIQDFKVEDANGVYTLPQINNITEDQHIVVTFAEKSKKLVVNKKDASNGMPLAGAKFEINQIDERTEPDSVIGDIVNHEEEYPSDKTLYNFETINEYAEETKQIVNKKYKSTNAGVDNTIASAYIPINLQALSGKYILTVNAEISSSGYNDYGYAVIKKGENGTQMPTGVYESGTTRVISRIYGQREAEDYTETLTGGEIYYLHFVYEKDNKSDIISETMEDAFTINSVKVTLSSADLYRTKVTTDEKGKAIVEVPIGNYKIIETEAPEGYEKNKQSVTCDTSQEHEVTIQNTKRPKLIVHHYLKGTEDLPEGATKVSEDEMYYGDIGEKYETKPRVDLEKFELTRNESGEYDIPYNAKGIYTEDKLDENREIVVTYYYTNKLALLTVHHYVEGTTDRVLNKQEEAISDITTRGEEGQYYETTAISSEELNEKYEALEAPANATGMYKCPEVEVTYEYKIKTYEITTKVKTHEEKDSLGIAMEVAGGSILGQDQIPYEIVKHGENNTKDIIATPAENYQVKDLEINGKKLKSIKINGVQVEENQYTVDEETGAVTLNKLNNITQNQEIEVEFEKVPAQVIVNHYIYDESLQEPYTKNKVQLADGTEAPEQIIKGKMDDIYVTKALENISNDYKLYKEPVNSSGIMTKAPIYVNYYYIEKSIQITHSITKDGTQIITSKDEEVHYKIKYTAQLDNYEGNATVTITDTLPYNLDQDAMKRIEGVNSSENDWLEKLLNGGKYDDETRKITWTETISNINTFTDSAPRTIEIEKNITVIFNGISTAQINTQFTNTVKGKIELNTTEQTEETEEVPYTTTAKFVKNIKVNKTWEHGKNTYDRPTAIKIYVRKVKAEQAQQEEPIAQCELNSQNNWTHLFTDLPKYDEDGNEIIYEVSEQAVEGEEELLKYYEQK